LHSFHADGINTETDTKKEYKLVPRPRGRNKRKPTKTSENIRIAALVPLSEAYPTSTAFVKTALFSLGGLLGWTREKGESGQNRTL
jgi:hypothetical protein